MIFLVRIRVLPKLLQTCRVFLSFFCQGQKIHQVRYVCPKKTVYLLKEYWLGELNRPSFCRCSKFHGVFGWKKLKNYEKKKHKTPRSSCAKRVPLEDFFRPKNTESMEDFFAQKDNLGIQWFETCFKNMFMSMSLQLEHPCHNYRNWKKSQSLIQWCSDVQNLKKKTVPAFKSKTISRTMPPEAWMESRLARSAGSQMPQRLWLGQKATGWVLAQLIDNWARRKSQNVSKSSSLMNFSCWIQPSHIHNRNPQDRNPQMATPSAQRLISSGSALIAVQNMQHPT